MRRLFGVVLAAMLVVALAAPALAKAPPIKKASVGDFFIRPGKLTIKKGTKVVWRWTGSIVHNVTVVSGPQKFHSRSQSSGSFSHTFTKKGTYHLECTIHPWMTETVVVK